MEKDYIEDESGAKFPLNYTFDGVNNFVFSADVMFEDLQALCLGFVSKLESAQSSVEAVMKHCKNCQYSREYGAMDADISGDGAWCSNSLSVMFRRRVFPDGTCPHFYKRGKSAPIGLRGLNSFLRKKTLDAQRKKD